MIADLLKIQNETIIKTNICIIGSGASGSVLATELSSTKNNICIFESGDFKQRLETQKLYDLVIEGYNVRENFVNRVREYGGSCSIWPGRTILMQKSDLEKRAWINMSGWPIDYSELVKYYKPALPYLSISAWRNYNYKNWIEVNKSEQKLFYNDKISPVVSLWSKTPERFHLNSRHQKYLSKRKNIYTYLNSNLTELILNEEKNRVIKAIFKSIKNNKITVKADIFILACGGIENARLLLLSNNQINTGIGNQNDLVGRFFMDHPKVVMGKVILNKPMSLDLFNGKVFLNGRVKLGFSISDIERKKNKLLNPYCTFSPVVSDLSKKTYSSFIKLAKRLLRKGYYGKITDFKSKIADVPEIIYELPPQDISPHLYNLIMSNIKKIFILNKFKIYQLVNYCEQEPNFNSRITLSLNKDKLGLNRTALNWKIGKNDLDSLSFLHRIIDENLKIKKLGYMDEKFISDKSTDLSDASHHMGTTRMANHSDHGVVDSNCKVYGIDNLFVSGSSVFPTSGNANPTLTIVALSIRLADYIKSL